MPVYSPAEGLGLRGQFELVCAAEADGRSQVREQRVRSPFHLGKAYWDGSVLLVQCVNATAGVFSGDRLELAVAVEAGASVLLTSPSAHRIHTMPEGSAEMAQRYTVAPGAWLEVMPELFIPQAGCRYRQTTHIEVEEGGELLLVETLAPGRAASGEVFAFSEVAWTTDLWCAGRRVARERYTLRPDDHSLWGLRRAFRGAAWYATGYLVSDRPGLSEAVPALEGLQDAALRVGASRIAPNVWVIRLLAANSPALKAGLAGVRQRLSVALPRLAANSRKL